MRVFYNLIASSMSFGVSTLPNLDPLLVAINVALGVLNFGFFLYDLVKDKP